MKKEIPINVHGVVYFILRLFLIYLFLFFREILVGSLYVILGP